jgi:hypothetical protein
VPAEVRLETPQVVEVLARPQQNEGRPPLRVVTAGYRVAHALEQAPPTFHVPDVRRRNRAAVDEGFTEGDVPRTQCVHLPVEVLAACPQAVAAFGHAAERRE